LENVIFVNKTKQSNEELTMANKYRSIGLTIVIFGALFLIIAAWLASHVPTEAGTYLILGNEITATSYLPFLVVSVALFVFGFAVMVWLKNKQ
jgi:hypothetical protein